MSLKDRFSQAANLTRWKADQQVRLLRVQNNIRELEGQVKTQKLSLADATLSFYGQNEISDPTIQSLCAAIGQLETQIHTLSEQAVQIQQEQPPSDNPPAPAPVPAPTPFASAPGMPSMDAPVSIPQPPAPQALVCPICGQALKGRFCPEHGAEGVPAQ